MTIKFYYKGTSLKIHRSKRLKQFIADLFEREEYSLFSLSYIFCTDKYLLSINKKFLRHNEYTDIITFCLSEPYEPIVGEIYISVERVKENAIYLLVPYNIELQRVILHGALHLCGYKDKSPGDKRRMTLAEDKYLKAYVD